MKKNKAVILKCFQAQVQAEVLSTGIYLVLSSINPYVGESSRVNKRIETHIREGVKKVVDWIKISVPGAASRLRRNQIEQAMIDIVKDIWGIPLENKVNPLGPKRRKFRYSITDLKKMLAEGICPQI